MANLTLKPEKLNHEVSEINTPVESINLIDDEIMTDDRPMVNIPHTADKALKSLIFNEKTNFNIPTLREAAQSLVKDMELERQLSRSPEKAQFNILPAENMKHVLFEKSKSSRNGSPQDSLE